MIHIKSYNEHNDLDPFNEEDWDDKNVIYDGDIISWAQRMESPKLITLIGDLLFSEEDISHRLNTSEELLTLISVYYPQYYDLVEDDVRNLV